MEEFKIHMCQSIQGALKNWDKKTWEAIGKDNGLSGAEMKGKFRIMDFEGKKVLPFGEPCEGFSYETGCPTHPSPIKQR